MKETTTDFNPIEAQGAIEGSYFANICSYEERTWDSPKNGLAYIYDLEVRLAEQNANLMIPLLERDSNGKIVRETDGTQKTVVGEDGKPITTPGKFLVGRKYPVKGVYFFPEAPGRNAVYSKLVVDALKLDVPTKDIGGGLKTVSFGRLEEEDVFGKPVIINLGTITFATKETKGLPKEEQDLVSILKANAVMEHWSKGETLTADEMGISDIPF